MLLRCCLIHYNHHYTRYILHLVYLCPCLRLSLFMFGQIWSKKITIISLKSDSYLPKNCFYLLQWAIFKNDEKCFSFHVKSTFRSWNIYISALSFCFCGKTAWYHTQNLVEKLVPDPSIKDWNSLYPWLNSVKCCNVCILLYAEIEVYQNILTVYSMPNKNVYFWFSKLYLHLLTFLNICWHCLL